VQKAIVSSINNSLQSTKTECNHYDAAALHSIREIINSLHNGLDQFFREIEPLPSGLPQKRPDYRKKRAAELIA
jgi:hypothetical protein